MSNRSWFFAFQGQQRGPYPEAQLREFIARGAVGADTLVWTEGMANWQRAADIPGMLSGGSGPPAMPQLGGAPTSAGHGRQLSIKVGLWPLLGWCLLFSIGIMLIIPAPWAATGFYRWLASRIEVPGRPNIAFIGQPGDIWYVFVAMGLLSYAGVSGSSTLELAAIVAQAALSWMNVRWISSNLSSNGEKVPITFDGGVWVYIGWYVLMYASAITIIGWAWVITAWVSWICRNISGTRREIMFNATGLELLWRTLVFAIGCALLIPIPWALRWYAQWYVSQFAVVERSAYVQA